MKKRTIQNTSRILEILRHLRRVGSGWVWIRQLGRLAKLHPYTVSRIVDSQLQPFIETQDFENRFNIKLRLIRLKDPNITLDKILKFHKVKNDIDEKM
jgi:hypothetical protein